MSTRVLYVHHRPEASGAAQSLALLIGALDGRFEPHVLVPGGAAAALFAAAGARVHAGPVSTFTHTWDVRYEGMRWAVLGREIARLPSHRRALARALDAVSPGLVHVNDAVAVVAGQLAHARGIPVVWHLRTSLAGGRRGRAVASRLDRWGAAAIAIDADVARSYPISLPTTVVPNPVGWAGAPPSRATSAGRALLGIPPNTVSVGFFGYLRRQKGWPELVHAADALVRRGVAFHVVVVGGGVRPPEWYGTRRGRVAAALRVAGDEETEMRELVERLGLTSRFSFVPFTDDVRAIYGALDIVVFPNTGAGLGRPVLEAAAAGVPVVASGSPDGAGILVPGETGTLLDRVAPEQLAVAVERLIRDQGARRACGRAAALHAALRFSPTSHARAVEITYDEVMTRAPERT